MRALSRLLPLSASPTRKAHVTQPRRTATSIASELREASLEALPRLVRAWKDDERKAVQDAVERGRRRIAEHKALVKHAQSLYAEQWAVASVGGFVVGLDEVGRGPLAGPLTVGAVVLPHDPMVLGLDDSKKLTAQRRAELSEEIREVALAVVTVDIPAEQIDSMGMALCLRAAFSRAITQVETMLDGEATAVFLDGHPLRLHPAERAFVKGDGRHACIAAASIVAKHTRDQLMISLDSEYPGYGFAASKGYACAEHVAAIKANGLTPLHRASFCESITAESLF